MIRDQALSTILELMTKSRVLSRFLRGRQELEVEGQKSRNADSEL